MNCQIVICFLCTLLITTSADLLSTRKEVNGNDSILYSCDFENDSCQMTLEPSATGFTWLRFSGSTPSETTGPDFDHTTLTAEGHYMYTEATEFEPGQIAKLRLPSLARKPQGAICLTFWYHMYGEHIGTLRVSQNDSVLSSIRFNQSYNWIQQNVTIKDPSAGPIIFVGIRGGSDIGQPYGDIAIDDIVIYDEPCEYEITTEGETTTTTTTTEITTTLITTTEARASTNTTLRQPSPSTVANVTQLPLQTTRLAVTSFQINQTNEFKVTSSMLTSSNNSTVKSLINSTDSNVTLGTQHGSTFTTDSNLTIARTESNTTVYNNNNVSKFASPAAIALTNSTVTTVSAIKLDSTSQNYTQTNTTDSSFSSASKYDSLQSTSGMPIDPKSQASSSKRIWNLTEQNLILLLAFLGAFILILILVVSVLACCLCVTRRRYNVARSTNVYNSNTTLDRSSLNENQRVTRRKNDLDY